jgi:hypothetical protein
LLFQMDLANAGNGRRKRRYNRVNGQLTLAPRRHIVDID